MRSDAPGQLHSPGTDNFFDNPQDSSRLLTRLLPKGLTSNILAFTTDLFHMSLPSRASLAYSRCSENLPFLLLALLPCSDFKLSNSSLSPFPSCFLTESLLHLAPSSYIYPYGLSMGKKLSSNPLTLSMYDLLHIETHGVFNHCMHVLSLIPVTLK